MLLFYIFFLFSRNGNSGKKSNGPGPAMKNEQDYLRFYWCKLKILHLRMELLSGKLVPIPWLYYIIYICTIFEKDSWDFVNRLVYGESETFHRTNVVVLAII